MKSEISSATPGPSFATSFGLVYLSSANAAKPKPVRLIVLRYSFGIIMSVSMFWMSKGAAMPFRTSNTGMPPSPLPAWDSRMIGPADSPASAYMRLWSAPIALEAASRAGTVNGVSSNWRTSAREPVTAAAAAMIGETRCVRPPWPCRPSKLRFEVDAHLSCILSLSAFIAKHIEQPGMRQSKPASVRTLSRPSSSACSRTIPEPGTTIAWT